MEHEPLNLRTRMKAPEPPEKQVEVPAVEKRPIPTPLIAASIFVALLLGFGWYVYGSVFFEAVSAPSDLSVAGLASSTSLKVPGVKISMTESELMKRVSKLIQVPEEEPTIAVVSDLAPLKSQAFFRNARVGDIVLMFKKSLKAILYDPEADKIIEVAPITFSDK